jgi:hypothetical protein
MPNYDELKLARVIAGGPRPGPGSRLPTYLDRARARAVLESDWLRDHVHAAVTKYAERERPVIKLEGGVADVIVELDRLATIGSTPSGLISDEDREWFVSHPLYADCEPIEMNRAIPHLIDWLNARILEGRAGDAAAAH